MRMRAMFVDRNGMFVTACPQVRGDALSFVKDLNGRWRRAHFHQLVNQVVWHAVTVCVEGDVVIDVHSCPRPLAEIERLRRAADSAQDLGG